jgi:hypothetical protein
VESTSDYWRIFYYLFEAAGLQVDLVNARDVKNVPGRPKTDRLDAVWLAKLTEKGLLRPSFVPPAPVRQLRDYTRLREELTRERTRERYRRIVKRRGKLKARVAVARSILVIVWHLMADPTARFHDLGSDYYTNRVVTERKLRNHIAQLAALGYRVTLEPAAYPKHRPNNSRLRCAPPGRFAVPTHLRHLPVSRRKSPRNHAVSGAFASARHNLDRRP